MVARTPLQRTADEFDRQVYGLLAKTERLADTKDKRQREYWQQAARHLRLIRMLVREMMHPDDRKGTVG